MRPEVRSALLSGAGMGFGWQIGLVVGAQWGFTSMLICGFIGSACGDLVAHVITERISKKESNSERDDDGTAS